MSNRILELPMLIETKRLEKRSASTRRRNVGPLPKPERQPARYLPLFWLAHKRKPHS
ncbi:hypothetical protein IF2G_07592 [Cordyceps javanica]|nr:hypothetical protein IF2G_07592 [Cordyceps javanica]